MKSYPTKFKSLLLKIVQMGTLQKLQNSHYCPPAVKPVATPLKTLMESLVASCKQCLITCKCRTVLDISQM